MMAELHVWLGRGNNHTRDIAKARAMSERYKFPEDLFNDIERNFNELWQQINLSYQC